MILGYGIIAVPTGIVSAEYVNQSKDKNAAPQKPKVNLNSQSCQNCLASNHKDEAEFCYNCGNKLH